MVRMVWYMHLTLYKWILKYPSTCDTNYPSWILSIIPVDMSILVILTLNYTHIYHRVEFKYTILRGTKFFLLILSNNFNKTIPTILVYVCIFFSYFYLIHKLNIYSFFLYIFNRIIYFKSIFFSLDIDNTSR